MRELVLVMLVAMAAYIVFGPKWYRSDIVGMSKADASDVLRAGSVVPAFVPEGSMIVAGGDGSGKSGVVVAGSYDPHTGSVKSMPTISIS